MTRPHVAGIALIVLAGAMLPGTVPGSPPTTVAAAQVSGAALIDLKGPGDLRERFNRDRGATRLVLLFSPT